MKKLWKELYTLWLGVDALFSIALMVHGYSKEVKRESKRAA